ncbi:PLXC1 protein, partial [Polypterus senegalus]
MAQGLLTRVRRRVGIKSHREEGKKKREGDWKSPCYFDLKPIIVPLVHAYITAIAATTVHQWTILFIGTAQGKVLKISMDKDRKTSCLVFLYQFSNRGSVFYKMLIDPAQKLYVYAAAKNEFIDNRITPLNVVVDVWGSGPAGTPGSTRRGTIPLLDHENAATLVCVGVTGPEHRSSTLLGSVATARGYSEDQGALECSTSTTTGSAAREGSRYTQSAHVALLPHQEVPPEDRHGAPGAHYKSATSLHWMSQSREEEDRVWEERRRGGRSTGRVKERRD